MGWAEVQIEAGSEAPVGRGGAACVAIGGGRILLYGGASREPTTCGDWWLLETAEGGRSGAWTRISPVAQLPHKRRLLPRSGASLTFVPAGEEGGSGRVYLFGGQDPVAGAIFDDLLALELDSWVLSDLQPERVPGQPPPLRPPARHSHVAGLYEQQGLIIYGGGGIRGPLSDVWLFEPAARQWRCLSAALREGQGPDAREMAAGCMFSDAGLLIHGGRGSDGQVLKDIAVFDARASKWVLHHDTDFARVAHTACNTAATAALQPAGSGGASVPAAAEPAAPEAAAADAVASTAAPSAAAAAPAAAAAAETAAAPAAAAAAAQTAAAQTAPAPAASSAEPRAAAGGQPGGAANVLLMGGFTGEAVTAELLQLTFLRQHSKGGGHGLRAGLRPVKQEGSLPPARFAHAAVALPGALVALAGVNQTEDLADAWMWSVVGPGGFPVQLDLRAVVESALVQLYGLVGAPAVEVDQQSGVVVAHKSDEAKVRAALALVSSHGKQPLRLDLS